ncbi:MFS transporter [Corynebacterium pseudokroppenstedtii]|uniref:MFS transporter n=1 Tax=Corynebacterium pseudokroppenstedtii TaxID=2804917 RepID=A0AAU0Q0F3_9CORY|nr:MFS transporter [Corynebacterium pseudokroppenstedtii]
MATQGLPDGYTPQSPMYRKVILAMVGAGLASFNALYCTQALLPVLSEDLHVTPATASLTVSATTGMLALSIIPASIISERFGRKRVIMLSALSATLLGLLLPLSTSVGMLITLRGLQGITVAGGSGNGDGVSVGRDSPETRSSSDGAVCGGDVRGRAVRPRYPFWRT